MAKEIIILHEYGDKRHYEALEYCSDYNVVYHEFSIFRQLLKFYKTRDFKQIYKLYVNLYFLSRINKIKNKIIVLGMAPYDWHILLFYKLFEKNKIIYHTSWTF